jgi:hypothetical protein
MWRGFLFFSVVLMIDMGLSEQEIDGRLKKKSNR